MDNSSFTLTKKEFARYLEAGIFKIDKDIFTNKKVVKHFASPIIFNFIEKGDIVEFKFVGFD